MPHRNKSWITKLERADFHSLLRLAESCVEGEEKRIQTLKTSFGQHALGDLQVEVLK